MRLRTQYVLVDYENVHLQSLGRLQDSQFWLVIFLGPQNGKLDVPLVTAIHQLGERAMYVPLKSGGPNALDFLIAYHLGRLAEANPDGFFHIISKDTGFDPLIEHLKARKIGVQRSPNVESMPCFVEVHKANGSAHVPSHEELVNTALADLIKRKSSAPRGSKALSNTVHAACGKHLPQTHVDAVCRTLVERGYIKVDGTKLSYSLPTGPGV